MVSGCLVSIGFYWLLLVSIRCWWFLMVSGGLVFIIFFVFYWMFQWPTPGMGNWSTDLDFVA